VTANATGQIVAAATGDSILGIAVTGGVSGDVISVLVSASGTGAAAVVS
jgi:hypothetical protein